MIRPLRARSSPVGLVFLVGVVLLGGIFLFWFGLRAFRTHASASSREEVGVPESSFVDQHADRALRIASLIAFTNGQDIGRATRVFSGDIATIDVLATLPSIDTAAYEYHVWLLKKGLADVVDVGMLTPRADGTWTGVFAAGPATGIVDPLVYSHIVVMLEPRDNNPAPSGVKVCEGSW